MSRLKKDFRQSVDAVIDNCLEHFQKNSPFQNTMLSGDKISLDYYKRHNIETILRLRMKRWIDALTIHYFTKHNPVLAKKWSHYTEDEMLHDRMFASDLEAIGVTHKEIYDQEPFFSTKLLQGYFYYGIEHEERPLASLCSSYFIEYASMKTQPKWLDHWAKIIGEEKVKGARAHVNHDIEDGHIDFVWNVLATFIKSPADEEKAVDHITNVYKLFVMYFQELHSFIADKRNVQDILFKKAS